MFNYFVSTTLNLKSLTKKAELYMPPKNVKSQNLLKF